MCIARVKELINEMNSTADRSVFYGWTWPEEEIQDGSSGRHEWEFFEWISFASARYVYYWKGFAVSFVSVMTFELPRKISNGLFISDQSLDYFYVQPFFNCWLVLLLTYCQICWNEHAASCIFLVVFLPRFSPQHLSTITIWKFSRQEWEFFEWISFANFGSSFCDL